MSEQDIEQMLTDIFRKHMGYCPIADSDQRKGDPYAEPCERMDLAELRRDLAPKLKSYDVPADVIAEVLGISKGHVWNLCRQEAL